MDRIGGLRFRSLTGASPSATTKAGRKYPPSSRNISTRGFRMGDSAQQSFRLQGQVVATSGRNFSVAIRIVDFC